MTGSATKARDTFDYKIKFKQGEYTFIEPSKILEDKTTDLITPEED